MILLVMWYRPTTQHFQGINVFFLHICVPFQLRSTLTLFLDRQDYLENVWTCCSVDRKILVKMSSQKWKRKIVDGKWSEKQIEDLVTPGMKITIFSKETVESNRKYFDFDALKSQIEKLISSFYLLHCDISFSFATDLSNMPLRLDRNGKINHAITAARQLFKPRTRKSVVPFHGSSHHFKIKGMVVIGEKRPTNNSFYIYVNGRLVESKDLTNYLTKGQNQPTILNIKVNKCQPLILTT